MKKLISLLLICALLFTGCGTAAKEYKTVYAMDTVMTLTAYGPNAAPALAAAEQEIQRLDALLSVTQSGSDIYRLNRDSTAKVSRETGRLLQRALEIADMTDGDFDPSVYPLTQLWGFATGTYYVPAQDELNALLPLVGYDQISVQEESGFCSVSLPTDGGVDLGGIAKGYTAERVLAVLEETGVSSAIVSLGGNVGVLGLKSDGSLWTVAIRDPAGDEGDYLATLSLGQAACCVYAVTSGAYERYFEQNGRLYHHILDPATGYPAETDLLSVTIISPDGTLADALSTALFVRGFDEAVAFWRSHKEAFEMVLVTKDGIFATPALAISAQQTVTFLEVAP